MSASSVHKDLLAAAANALPPGKLSAIRSAALSSFCANGFPTSKDEDWRYTSLAHAVDVTNNWLKEGVEKSSPEVDQRGQADERLAIAIAITSQVDACWLIVRNGVVDRESFAGAQSYYGPGMEISRLVDGLQGDSIAIDDGLSAFNATLLQDGLHIRISKDFCADKPLGILFTNDATSGLSQERVIVDAGDNSHARIFTCTTSAGAGKYFSNSVTQISLAAGAQLDYVQFQQRDQTHLGVSKISAQLQRDAVFNHNAFDLGSEMARNDVVIDIAGPGASANLHGLYLATGKQHIDNHVQVTHGVGPATSSQVYRGILSGRSRCVFNGKAVVLAGADGTDANQSNHNLLLSEKAEIDTKPELEIYADDVKCSHGATVGQLDEAALFYLRSRGLAEDDAKRALTRAFASGMLSALVIDECRDYISNAIDQRLDELISEDSR
jgi:Fe-S cluster assembly protein SufD